MLAPKPPVTREPELIFVRLPEPLQPIERGDRYEDPLDEELKLAGVGEVSGGGSSLSELRADGSRTIEWCGVDVDTHDPRRALEVLRRKLPQLGCHAGTCLDYRLDGVSLTDEFDGENWVTSPAS